MSISVRIHLMAGKGKEMELLQTVESLSKKIVLEPGCVGCQVFQSTNNDCEVVLIEEWENFKAAQSHLGSSNVAILAGAGTILADTIRVYPEKDPEIEGLKESLRARISAKSHI